MGSKFSEALSGKVIHTCHASDAEVLILGPGAPSGHDSGWWTSGQVRLVSRGRPPKRVAGGSGAPAHARRVDGAMLAFSAWRIQSSAACLRSGLSAAVQSAGTQTR